MVSETLKKHDNESLEALYRDAEGCDQDIFSEMRSNVLLVSGEHYNRRHSNFYKKLRDSESISEQQKIRITKNHIQNICSFYVSHILSMNPSVGFEPKNDSELSDQKSAELHHSVWRDAVDKYGLDERFCDWAEEFVQIGEVAVKVFFDPSAGPIKAYRQKLDENGAPLFNVDGSMAPDLEQPVYTGDFVFEQVYGFNLLRCPDAKSFLESPFLAIKKMVSKSDLIAKFPGKEKFIEESYDQTLMVFDGAKNGYRKTSHEVLLQEFYFRPCPQYPQGYFFFKTRSGILAEGPLPGGIFPIVVRQLEKVPTAPRGRSPIKTMRPYQAEINRAASKIAEHQITLGDDKLLVQNGTSITAGKALPGIRSVNYSGMAPTILSGRDGSQYLSYLNSQVEELYRVMNAEELLSTKEGQMDPWGLLFRAASQKKKFSRPVKRFEYFLIDVVKTYLKLAKIHLSEDALVYVVGSKEQVNIAEFKNSQDICYQIKVVPQAEDIETKFGKQLLINHALQYVGNKLEKEDIGKLMRAMPYGNFEESFNDMTLDYDSATNDILSLDRGEQPPIQEYDNHVYLMKRLVARMRQADFKYLPPQIQQNYISKIQLHEKAHVEHLAKLKAIESELIPTGGYLVVCDLYVSDPVNPVKTRRARLPYEALTWLIQRLEAQGKSLEQLENMNPGAQDQMAELFLQAKAGMAPNGGGPEANPMRDSTPGAEIPGGVKNAIRERSPFTELRERNPVGPGGPGQPVFA